MPGFGELFRAISVEEIGTSSLQSRAFAGLANAHVPVRPARLDIGLPHGWERIIRAQLDARTRPCNLGNLATPSEGVTHGHRHHPAPAGQGQRPERHRHRHRHPARRRGYGERLAAGRQDAGQGAAGCLGAHVRRARRRPAWRTGQHPGSGAHQGRTRPAGRLPRAQHPAAGRVAGSRAQHESRTAEAKAGKR